MIVSASPDVFANDMGVARLGDTVLADCGHTGIIVSASPDVFANDMGVARLGDAIYGDYDATIVEASLDVYTNGV